MLLKRRACLAAGGIALAGLSTPCAGANPSAGSSTVRRRLRFAVTLLNPSAQELRDQAVWLYVPAHSPPAQRLVDITASSGIQVLTDVLGHRIANLSAVQMPPFSRKIVSLSVEVELSRAPAAQAIDDRAAWLASERYIEIDDPQIRSLAAQLRRGGPEPTARAIYEWLRSHLSYEGYVADDRGAAYAAAQRRGDCTEYAFLAVALARANGIPARMVGGHVVAGDSVPRAEDYHNWAEVYLDGSWRLLDAQKERWLSSDESYVAFRYFRDAPLNPVGLAHRFKASSGLEVRL
jgi:transglutaminase-like putative cysteine protease